MQVSKKNFLKNMISFSMMTWISFVIGFVASPIATRVFLPSELAKVSLFSTYGGLFTAFAYVGLDQAYVRFFREPPKPMTAKGVFTLCTLVSLAVGFVICIGLFFASDTLSKSITGEVDLGITLCLILFVLSSIVFRFLSLNYRMEQNALLYTIQGVVNVFLTKIAYLAVGFGSSRGQEAIILLTILKVLFSLVFLIIQRNRFSRHLPVETNKTALKEIGRFATPLIPLALFTYINTSASQLVLNVLMDKSTIGIYASALGLATTVNIIQTGFNTYWAPYVLTAYQSDERKRFDTVHRMMACLLCLFALGLTLVHYPLFLLLGENYRSSMVFFPFLLLSPVCYCLGETTGMGITLAKKTYYTTLIYVISALCNIGLCFVFIPIFGMAGAAMASAVAAIITVVLRTFIGERLYHAIHSWRYLWYCIGLCLLASVANYLLHGVLLYACLLGLLAIAMYLFRHELRTLVRTGLEILHKR